MELLEGQSLTEIIEKGDFLPIEDCMRIMHQLADTISKVHSKGILHRDIKPANIMLISGEKERYFVKLLDFGLAKTQFLSTLTEAGDIFGTLFYLPPERIRFEPLTIASDIYSLGVVFYELVTFQKPFSGETPEDTLIKIKDIDPKIPSTYRTEISDDLNNLILKMINKDPILRPSNEDILNTLKTIANL
jgi:serine/threonine-protein kinase